MSTDQQKGTRSIIYIRDMAHFRTRCDECVDGYLATVSRKVFETARCFMELEKVTGKPGWFIADCIADGFDYPAGQEEHKFWCAVSQYLKTIDFCCEGAIKITLDQTNNEGI